MIETKLKSIIIERYGSIRQFSIVIGIPYSTIDSVFKRGIINSSVLTIIKICEPLEISVDALLTGVIEYKHYEQSGDSTAKKLSTSADAIAQQNTTFGENVRYYRMAKKMSQYELAELCGYKSRVSICNIERGCASPHASMVEKIANALGVRVLDLLIANEGDYTLNDYIERSKGKEFAILFNKLSALDDTDRAFVYELIDFLLAKRHESAN